MNTLRIMFVPFNLHKYLKYYNTEIDKDHLFILGCARSGTTVLTTIIGSHKKVVLGMERYVWLSTPKEYRLSKQHFEKTNFFDIKHGETHYQNFRKFKVQRKAKRKWNRAEYVGDKIPDLDLVLPDIIKTFEQVKLVYIYRDIYEVAESWNKRAEIGNEWQKDRDFRAAVQSWNRSLSNILSYIYLGYDILCLNYYDLLFTEKSIDNIFEYLSLKSDWHVKKELYLQRKRAYKIRNIKGDLDDKSKRFISQNADMTMYNTLNKYCNVLKFDSLDQYNESIEKFRNSIKLEFQSMDTICYIDHNNFLDNTCNYSDHISEIETTDLKQIKIKAIGPDPFFSLNRIPIEKDYMTIVRIKITYESNNTLQLFFQTNKTLSFNYGQSSSRITNTGVNEIYFRIEDIDFNGQLRIDPGVKAETYLIHSIEIRSGKRLN